MGGTYDTNGSAGQSPVRVAVTELRDDLAEWLNRVAWGGETLLVHRRGRPLALVLPVGVAAGSTREGAGMAGASPGTSTVPPPLGWEKAVAAEGEIGPVSAAGPQAGGQGGPAAPGEDHPATPRADGGAAADDRTVSAEGCRPGAPEGRGESGSAADRDRDREDLRAIFRAIAASAGEVPRAWRPVRPDGPRVRLLAAAARELRALGGERRAAAERLLDLLAAGSLADVPPLPGTGGRVYRFVPREEEGGGRLLWRREGDGSLTVLVVRLPGGAGG